MDHLEGLKILAPWGMFSSLPRSWLWNISSKLKYTWSYPEIIEPPRIQRGVWNGKTKEGKHEDDQIMIRLGSIFLTGNARVSVHGIASAIAFVHLQSLESTNL